MPQTTITYSCKASNDARNQLYIKLIYIYLLLFLEESQLNRTASKLSENGLNNK